MNNKWLQSGNTFWLGEVSTQKESLPNGVYLIEEDSRTKALSLLRTGDKLPLPSKIYGFEEFFINHAIKTYNSTGENLGILLNGVRGTGKTVTAKSIANMLNLPVIVVTENFEEFPQYLNLIQQDVVVLIDEYEKVFEDESDKLLSVMDGALSSPYRRVFILTTNHLWINENLLQRPSRIRYVRAYEDLSIEHIREIISDKLINKSFSENVESFLSTLDLVTVDIVQSIIDECNIHNLPPQKFGDFFNVKKSDDNYNVWERQPSGEFSEEPNYVEAKVSPGRINDKSVGKHLTINGDYNGRIIQVEGDIVTTSYNNKKTKYKLVRTLYTHKSFVF